MSPSPDPFEERGSAAGAGDVDERLATALDEYLAAREAGIPLTAVELVGRYPDIADELQACLSSLQFIEAATIRPALLSDPLDSGDPAVPGESEETRPAGQSLERRRQPGDPDSDSGMLSSGLQPPSPSPGDTTIPLADHPAAGQLGDFRVIREIGRGGMGIVYEAEQISLSRRVALKVLPFAGALDRTQLARFKMEAQAAAQLHHGSIVPVYAVGCERGIHFYAMQYVEGRSLAELIHDARQQTQTTTANKPGTGSTSGTGSQSGTESRSAGNHPAGAVANTSTMALHGLSTGRAASSRDEFRAMARLALDVAEALAHAHQSGVVHRDIKPANLLVDAWGKVWVTDFGLARVVSDPGLTATGDMVGTLRYASPEQLSGQRDIADPRSDLYSLGITLYELLTLRPAFPGSQRAELLRRVIHDEPSAPRRINPAIPTELQTIVLKAIEKDPVARYATAQALADDLRRFLDDRPIQARPPSRFDRWRKWARRHRELVVSAVVAGVILLVLIAIGSTMSAMWLAAERNRAQTATDQATHDLWEARLAQARALRVSGQAGQRVDSLQALSEAAAIRPSRELRDEAIAALSLPDLPLERRWQSAPYASVRAIDFDGTLRLYARYEGQGVITIRQASDDTEQQRLPAGPGMPYFLRFSPDARWLAVSYYRLGRTGFDFRVWSVDAQQFVFTDDEHATERACAFHPGEAVIAVGRSGGKVDIVGLPHGDIRRTLPLKADPVALSFHPLGHELAVIESGSRAVGLWSLSDDGTEAVESAEPAVLSHPDVPMDVDYSSDGSRLAVGLRDTHVIVWDMATRHPHGIFAGHTRTVDGIRFQPHGRWLASFGWGGRTILWDAESGVRLLTLPGTAVRFSDDGRRFVLQNGSQLEVRRVVEHVGVRRFQLQSPGSEPATDLAFLRDNHVIVSGGDDGVRVWDALTGRILARLTSRYTYSVAFSAADGLITADIDGVRIWPLAVVDHAHERVYQLGPAQTIPLPAGSSTKWIAVGQHVRPAEPQGGTVHGVASRSADIRGMYVVLRSHAEDLLVGLSQPQPAGRPASDLPVAGVNVSSRRLRKPFYGRHPAISPDGRFAALGGTTERPVVVWTLPSDALHASSEVAVDVPPHELSAAMRATVDFSPDSQWLVTCTADEYRFWKTDGWQAGPVIASTGNDRATDIAFSPDGRLLAVAQARHRVLLYDTATHTELAALELTPNPARIESLTFSPDGSHLGAAFVDAGLCVWDLRQLREQLAGFGLDWSSDPPPPELPASQPQAIRIEVVEAR